MTATAIDPRTAAVPVLPAAEPSPVPPRPPRYLSVPRDEDDPRALHTVVRRDGLPLGAASLPPRPAPAVSRIPADDAPWRRRFGLDRPASAPTPPPLPMKSRADRLPAPPAFDPDAPVFTPDELRAARTELGDISQRDLAPCIGTNRGQLAGAEAGTRYLSPRSARLLAGLLEQHRARKGA